MTLIGLDHIAEVTGFNRQYVRDRLVTRADFPAPALELSQKSRKWDRVDFDKWLAKQARKYRR